MAVPSGNKGENGLPCEVDTFDNAVREFSSIQDPAHRMESGPISPEKGLRQGDLLSPYLSILCADGLSSTLRDLQAKGLKHGCSIARNAPSFTLIFCRRQLLFQSVPKGM